MADAKPETTRQKFVRLGQARTSKALAAVSNIGKLGNTKSYEYTKADIDKINAALSGAVKTAVEQLENGLKGEAPKVVSNFNLEG